MATKTLTKQEKVYNLLKAGKKVTAQTLTKRAYGEYTEENYKNVRSIISRLRNEFGYDIEALGNKTYKMN